MDTKKLRQKILDLAIHGKLVPQDPNDEPAIELLKRINPEFEACDNTPRIYSIPNSWCWTTLGCVCDIVTGSTPSKTQLEYYGGEFPFYKPSDLDAGRHVTIPSEYLSEAGKKVSRIIPKDSTAICCIGSIGKCGYIEKEGTTNQQINTAVPSKGLNPLYLYYFCNSTFFGDNLSADSSAITISIVNKSKLGKMHMPVPPIAEQKRIVTAIEQWFALIDILENEKSDLQASIQQAKSKILDLAIHGKLVPQDPNDEPAIELLKRINPKFKPCNEEDYPYEVPEGWTFCHLQDVLKISMGSSPVGESLNRIGEGIEFHQGKLCFSEMFLGISDVYSTEPIKKANPFSLLLCVRAPVGIVNICNREICIGRGLCALTPLQGLDLKYGFYTLQTCQQDFEQKATGSTFKAIGGDVVKNQIIPLPPHQEQLRIVAKIEALFAVLDSIKESLE